MAMGINIVVNIDLAAAYLLLAAQLFLPAMAVNEAAAAGKWQQLQWSCIDGSNSLMQEWTRTDIECLFKSLQTMGGDAVAEWNSDTGVCSVYAFCEVSHLANTSTSESVCAVYRRIEWTVNDFVQSLSKKFVAAWVFGADANTKNLVSGSNTNKNRFYPFNIAWTAEGAIFNGVNSYMALNDTEYMNFDNGFAWLLRLKRQPRVQRIMLSVSCSDLSNPAGYMLEWDAANKLHYDTKSSMHLPHNMVEKYGSMPNDANTWTNIGLTVSSAGINVFSDCKFVPDSDIDRDMYHGTGWSNYCFMLGYELIGTPLQGTVRAVGIANASMTEAEIRQFFSMLPNE